MTTAARSHALDGLRGWLAVVVCIYHGILIPDPNQVARIIMVPLQDLSGAHDVVTKFFFTLLNGDLAVTIFFIMSGAVLHGSLRHLGDGNVASTGVSFLVKRILRIYPALVAALMLFWAAMSGFAAVMPSVVQVYFTPGQLLENMLLWKISMYGAAWTLQVEMLAVPFIFGAMWLYSRLGLLGLWLAVGYGLLAAESNLFTFGLPRINGALLAFAMGMLVPTTVGEILAKGLKPRDWAGITLMMVFGRMWLPYAAYSGMVLQTLLGFILVAIIFWQRSAGLERALTTRSSLFLGHVSYSFYLLNPIALELLLRIIGSLTGYPPARVDRGLLLGLLATLSTLPVALLCTRFIEIPGMQLARRLTAPLQTRRRLA